MAINGEWDPEEVVRSMEFETRMDEDGDAPDYHKTTQRLLTEYLPHAAHSLIHLGLYSTNEKIRLDAAKEILNRGLGKVTDQGIHDEDNDPLARFTGTFIKDAEDFANATTETGQGSPDGGHNSASPGDSD
jgi:hypothetical protein